MRIGGRSGKLRLFRWLLTETLFAVEPIFDDAICVCRKR